MKKLILILFVILLIPCMSMAGMLQGIVGGGGAVTCSAAYFSDDFTAADGADAKRAVWTGETDTGSLLSIASNALLFTHTATTVGYVSKTLASTYTETWTQFTWKPSDIAMGGNTTYMNIIYLRNTGAANSIYVRVLNNAGGSITKVFLYYYTDAAVSTEVGNYTFNPSNGTTYTFKIHTKISTDVDTSDGVATLYIDGTSRITASNLDFFTYADIKYVDLGNKYSTFTDTAGKTFTFDNFSIRGDDCF